MSQALPHVPQHCPTSQHCPMSPAVSHIPQHSRLPAHCAAPEHGACCRPPGLGQPHQGVQRATRSLPQHGQSSRDPWQRAGGVPGDRRGHSQLSGSREGKALERGWKKGKVGKRVSPCSTPLLLTPLIFHFFSLALATHSGPLERSWHRGVPWGPSDPWSPIPPSPSLLTSSLASPSTEGFLCPAPLPRAEGFTF